MRFAFERTILDTSRRELTRDGVPVAVEPQVFDLLAFLIGARDRVVSKDDLLNEVWGGRIVSESTLATRINAARRAIGDSGEAQRLIRTVARKGFRFVGDVAEAGDAPAAPDTAVAMPKQEITFCRTDDGVTIAMAAVGKGKVLLKTANWLNHLEHDWQGPLFAETFRALASRTRFIRYDGRGNGLSDWDPPEISFAAFQKDLDAVVASQDLDTFALFGQSQGAALAIAYAASHPDKVTRMVLVGGYARGRRHRDNPGEGEIADAFLPIMRNGWGDEHSPFARMFGSLVMPDGNPEQLAWFAELQRVTTTGENAARIRSACDDIAVADLLPRIAAPTIVFHCRHDTMVPFDEGRLIASAIPGARLVPLDSANHIPLPGEPAWETMIAEIATFLDALPGPGDAAR